VSEYKPSPPLVSTIKGEGNEREQSRDIGVKEEREKMILSVKKNTCVNTFSLCFKRKMYKEASASHGPVDDHETSIHNRGSASANHSECGSLLAAPPVL
jgi:hypothetical protein